MDFDDIVAPPASDTERGSSSFMPSARRIDKADRDMDEAARDTVQAAAAGQRSTVTGRGFMQVATAFVGIAVLAMVFLPVASNVFRTGAAATTAGFVAVGLGAVVGWALAVVNDQTRYIVGWVLGCVAAGLAAVTIAAMIATLGG